MERISIDLIPGGYKPTCHATQFDDGRVIRFDLFNRRVPYTLISGESVEIKITKPNGSERTEYVANTQSSYVDWTTVKETCDVAGDYSCELVVSKDGKVIGSGNFTLAVEIDAYGDSTITVHTASGAIATFTTNIVDLLQSVKCGINAWSDSNVIEEEPYNFRKVAGTASRIGNHLFDKLVGGTAAWNQLAQKLDAYSNYSMNGIDITANSDNTLTIDGTATGSLQYSITKSTITLIKDHIYFVPIPTGLTNLQYYINGVNNNFVGIFKCDYTNETNRYICIKFVGGDSFNNYKMPIIPQIFDLTAMFGSTIADYIYSLEQATAGAGVAFFRKLFPKDYYAYNAGELMSVKTTAHVMKNASNTVIGNYALDSNLELRGLFKLDSNNKLYADGDTYESSGAVGRRFTLLDLGSVNYVVEATGTPDKYRYRFSSSVDAVDSDTSKVHSISKLELLRQAGTYDADKDGYTIVGGIFYVYLSAYSNSADPSAVKSALSGVYLLYEKTTPTTETADTFTNPQQVDANGTEEYVDSRSVAIPVGHETYYVQAYSECNVMANGTTHNIPFGELVVESAELDVTNGILKRHDDTTKQLTPLALEAVLGQNSVSCDTGNTEVKYLKKDS